MSSRRMIGLVAALVLGVGVAWSVGLENARAATSPPGNNFVIGSGSQTSYALMTAMDKLFNGLPGCNLVALQGIAQQLDFSCTPGATSPVPGNGENWIDDVALQEPSIGSSNGIEQLENQGVHTPSGIHVAPMDFATSSRAASGSHDDSGLNFVAYAKDGVSWFHWTKVLGKATPSAKVTNLTTAQLQGIWSGRYTNWAQVGGASAPIAVYAAAAGSGTESTWSQFLGINDQSYILSKGAAYANKHLITEGEDASIVANGDERDAIFYFGDGAYTQSCLRVCGGGTVAGTSKLRPTTTAIGKVNGIAPSAATILNGTFPVPRFLWNVYSNGANANLVKASASTLNFVSEVGFLCKPQTYVSGGKTLPILDPTTGVPVRTEIDNVITANGFFPLPLGEEGVVAHPANLAGTPFAPYDPTGQSEYQGYCLVTTTDGFPNM